jgi:glutaconate CoA-transferase subunit B
MFAYWLQGGRIDVGFLGAAQIDRFGNLNTTVIGEYNRPKTRLPGAGGAPEIAASAKEVLLILKQDKRTFVERLDFLTTPGFLSGGDSRAQSGAKGAGPTRVITDLCVLEPDPKTKELTLVQLHPGVDVERVRAATGWPLAVSKNLRETPAPAAEALKVLRDLKARTAAAHAG